MGKLLATFACKVKGCPTAIFTFAGNFSFIIDESNGLPKTITKQLKIITI